MAVEFAPNPYSSDMAVIGKVDAAHTRQSARVKAREGELRLAGKPVYSDLPEFHFG
jgi:hypothetical protein